MQDLDNSPVPTILRSVRSVLGTSSGSLAAGQFPSAALTRPPPPTQPIRTRGAAYVTPLTQRGGAGRRRSTRPAWYQLSMEQHLWPAIFAAGILTPLPSMYFRELGVSVFLSLGECHSPREEKKAEITQKTAICLSCSHSEFPK